MRLCRLCSRLCHWSSGAWDSWRQILPVKTTVKSCVRKRCEKPCLASPHLHSRAAFKLRHLSLVLTWAMLQPCLCLAMHPTDPDRDPLTSFPCFTSDHHYRLAWKSRLLPNLVTVTRYTLFASCKYSGTASLSRRVLSLPALLSPLSPSLPSLQPALAVAPWHFVWFFFFK